MENASFARTVSFRVKNLSFIRAFLEKNRWLVALYFERVYRGADPYNYGGSPHERLKRERIFDFIKDRGYSRVLEVGCGEGYQTVMLAPLAGSLTGLDISRKALERARKMLSGNPAVSFERADVLSFCSKEKFDLVTCCDVFCYLNPAQIKTAAGNLADMLEPGGRMLAVDIFAASEKEGGLALKKKGAGSIHPLLERVEGLKVERIKTFDEYEMVLFEKSAAG